MLEQPAIFNRGSDCPFAGVGETNEEIVQKRRAGSAGPPRSFRWCFDYPSIRTIVGLGIPAAPP